VTGYKALSKQIYTNKDHSIVPIRMQDRYLIMQWRNEQIYHLRQEKPLTKEEQDFYFENVVAKLFKQEQPDQILFSYLEGEKCIGYGGLVHINWKDKNAEISFIMDTSLEKDHFKIHWLKFLDLIELAAFEDLELHKLYTYAFDLRPKLYEALEECKFKKEAILKSHILYNEEFKDVIIHSKFTSKGFIRKATQYDTDVTYLWANDPKIREYSLNKEKIEYEKHKSWYLDKINSNDCLYLILQKNENAIGSIRFDFEDEGKAKINYLIEPKEFGKGYGTLILQLGVKYLMESKNDIKCVYGIVFHVNEASVKIFEKLGYEYIKIDKDIAKYQLNI